MKKIHREVIAGVLIWIDENIHRPLHIDNIALKSGYSRFYLQRLFQEYTGVPLAKYVRELKLKRAAEALKKTNASIAEIACDFGFNGQQTFTRMFKHHYNISPGKWRRQIKLAHNNPAQCSDDTYQGQK